MYFEPHQNPDLVTFENDDKGPVVVETYGMMQKVYWGSGNSAYYMRGTPEYWAREYAMSGEPDPYRYIDLRNFDPAELDRVLGISKE